MTYSYRKIRELNVGDSFGELAIISEDKQRSATIMAEEPVVLASLS
jgi:CRP-like cAMP-binding protein